MGKSDTKTSVDRVVLVGHCGADTGMLYGVVAEALPGMAIASAHSDSDLRAADGRSLLLVNRVLEGSFIAGGGLDLVESLAKRDNPPRVILISNYPDAQDAARKAGALPGFGKSAAHTTETARLLRDAAGLK